MSSIDADHLESTCQAIEQEGFVVLENLIPPEQAARLAHLVEQAPVRDPAHRGYEVRRRLLDHDLSLADILAFPLLLGIARHFIGGRTQAAPNAFAWPAEDQIRLMGPSGLVAGPGADAGVWHLDPPMGQLNSQRPVPDFPFAVQVIWMFTPFTEENGGTRVMPRSHLLRRIPPATGESLDGQAYLCGSAGSVGVFPNTTWHVASENRTDQARIGLGCFYTPWWLNRPDPSVLPISRETYERLPKTVKPLLKYQLHWSVDVPNSALER